MIGFSRFVALLAMIAGYMSPGWSVWSSNNMFKVFQVYLEGVSRCEIFYSCHRPASEQPQTKRIHAAAIELSWSLKAVQEQPIALEHPSYDSTREKLNFVSKM